MQTSSLISRHVFPTRFSDICLSPPGQIAGVIKPMLLDKAWSSDGRKMILRAALPSRTKKFRATNFRRQQSTIAADFVRGFACGGTGTARALNFKSSRVL